jgi:leucyl aminopeptidase
MQHFLVENNLLNPSDCLIIGVLENQVELPKSIQNSKPLKSFCEKQIPLLQKPDDWVWQADLEQQNVILIHLGKIENFQADSLKKSLKKVVELIKDKPWKSISLILPDSKKLSSEQMLKLSITSFENGLYQFNRYKSKANSCSISEIYYDIGGSQKNIDEAIAICAGMRLCQDLANTPANDCTPIDLEAIAKNLAKNFPDLKFKSLDVPAMKDLGMNTLLSVGQGSANPPRLVELHYQKGGEKKPLILIGKGITFDTGGICLKPADPMFEMKYDMIGAASVLGTMQAIAMLQLPINVIGIMACAENMPSGTATRPGDVVKSHLGKTVEIINTDAEGRLVLADAISYCKQYQPEAIVDIATLTGAIIIALGSVYTGLMSNNDKLAKSLLNASQIAHDKVWQLPLDDEYKEFLFSPVADLANAHLSRVAGSITAAHFLNEFAEDTPWAHLDIAGSGWVSGKNRQATGRPVNLLVEWVKNYHHDKN